MKLLFIPVTQVWTHYSKLFYRVQSTKDEKARFIKGNELKLTQVELFSFLFFKRGQYGEVDNVPDKFKYISYFTSVLL